MSIIYPKLFQFLCICTHPCYLATQTTGRTPFHPPWDTTTLTIIIDGVQRVCQILGHGAKRFQKLVQIAPAGGWLLWGSGCEGPLTPRQKQ